MSESCRSKLILYSASEKNSIFPHVMSIIYGTMGIKKRRLSMPAMVVISQNLSTNVIWDIIV